MPHPIAFDSSMSDLGTPNPKTANLKDAAGKFEALLLAQMLKSARESDSGGWSGEADDQSSSSIMDMAEQHLAELLGAQGTLGIANLVISQIGLKK